MKLLITILVILPALALSGQSDPAANKILDRFSAAASAAPSVSLTFKLITVDLARKSSDSTSGLLVMMKDQYRLELEESITWYNGTTSWNYLIREKEVNITKPDKKEDSFFTRPSSLFTLYRSGYKTRLIEENNLTAVIDLYPEESESELVRIRLTIGKSASDLKSAEYKRKDGVSLFLVVNDYNLKQKPDQSAFSFDQKKYKGVEIIDMR
jgi:outer membrane lipoprotein-sorting protein